MARRGVVTDHRLGRKHWHQARRRHRRVFSRPEQIQPRTALQSGVEASGQVVLPAAIEARVASVPRPAGIGGAGSPRRDHQPGGEGLDPQADPGAAPAQARREVNVQRVGEDLDRQRTLAQAEIEDAKRGGRELATEGGSTLPGTPAGGACRERLQAEQSTQSSADESRAAAILKRGHALTPLAGRGLRGRWSGRTRRSCRDRCAVRRLTAPARGWR